MTAILILRLVSGRACGQGPCTENSHVIRTEINATTGFPGTMAAPETLYGQKKTVGVHPSKKNVPQVRRKNMHSHPSFKCCDRPVLNFYCNAFGSRALTPVIGRFYEIQTPRTLNLDIPVGGPWQRLNSGAKNLGAWNLGCRFQWG